VFTRTLKFTERRVNLQCCGLGGCEEGAVASSQWGEKTQEMRCKTHLDFFATPVGARGTEAPPSCHGSWCCVSFIFSRSQPFGAAFFKGTIIIIIITRTVSSQRREVIAAVE